MFRVLDYSYTGSRLFFNFYELDTSFKGLYDIIIVHRHSFQDDMSIIKRLLNHNGTIIVDITSESGCIDDFFSDYFNQIVSSNPTIKFILVSEFDSSKRCEFDNVDIAIDNRLLETIFSPLYPTDSNWNLLSENIFHKTNDILTLNGSTRVHRILLLLHLYKNNLLDRVKCSFKFYDHSDINVFQEDIFNGMVSQLQMEQKISEDDVLILNNIKDRLPINIDDYDGRASQESMTVFSSIVNLVSENVYGYFCCNCDKPSVTLTEKTLKPFMTQTIPIFLALPNTVSYVRSMGYDVFDDIIDHSYDNETDELKRMGMIMDELKRIIDIDLLSFYNDNKERFIKNREMVYQRSIGGYTFLRNFLAERNLL